MAPKLSKEPDVIGPSFDLYIKYKIWPLNLDLTAQQLDYMQGVNVKLGRQQAKLPPERIANFTIRDRLLGTMGRA